jgi:hypothetical protein
VNKKRSAQLTILGTSASILCAIHCISLPFLLSAGALGLSNLFTNPYVEFSLISISLVFGYLIIRKGYATHQQIPIVLLFGISSVFLVVFGLILHDHTSVLHTAGSIGVAFSFLLNWKAQH